MPEFTVITPEIVESARKLRGNGYQWPEIARRLGVSSAALRKKFSYPQDPQAAIDARRMKLAQRIAQALATYPFKPITLPYLRFLGSE